MPRSRPFFVPGGHLILMDCCFAPGVSADETERAYAHMERIVGHSDRGRYFTSDAMARLFTEAGLMLIERRAFRSWRWRDS